MALWKKVQCLPTETLNSLYPPTFPIEVRHYLASWLEEQPWYVLGGGISSDLELECSSFKSFKYSNLMPDNIILHMLHKNDHVNTRTAAVILIPKTTAGSHYDGTF
ncbi:hypothetical protein EOD39_17755 [Acipenser ruthenus]|uniref:STAT transcription factor protein interaction domain-containing protein n=1 Tax=Acipenser ruthenus TaxID=7906 RepID=A0A444V2J2_ACIRT|nr:hypothetical protein EOD39_17755 [Acipenser ruthenus]